MSNKRATTELLVSRPPASPSVVRKQTRDFLVRTLDIGSDAVADHLLLYSGFADPETREEALHAHFRQMNALALTGHMKDVTVHGSKDA